ncbi:MAG TPA: DUF6268 family outer membrane beta-barrel protein [Pseudobacter sp.]|nr:DUF6268 family outer membrane beta-barrel protein [Pseudobacter sp.]
MRSLLFIMMTMGFIMHTVTEASAQSGAGSLTGPGFGLEASYLPAAHYIRPEDSLKMPANSRIQRLSMAAAFNLYTKSDTATGAFRQWSIGMSGHYMRFNNQEYEKMVMPEKLLGTSIALQHVRSLRNRWSAMMLISGGIYSDMEKYNYDDIFLTGGVLFIKQHNSKFSYGFGAMLTNSFGTPMVLPGLLLQFNTGKKINVEIILPEKFALSYQVNPLLKSSIAVRMNGGAYDVENQADNRRLMAYKEMTAGWENDFRLTKHLHFCVAGGAALLRSVDYRKKSLSEMFKTRPEHRLEPNFFASAGIRVSFNQ